ncbi:hypothetical protein [Kitasatospora acidiphila]|uniref:hypothetical protein n=1 Tax=Kitasatospora acidiphila TaxID=2567942 RepID=UPI003C71F47E
MRKRMLMRAVGMLVGAGLAATVAPAAVAAPAPQLQKAPVTKNQVRVQAPRTAEATGNATANAGKLTAGQQLLPGAKAVDNDATLEMQVDGNLVIYLNTSSGQHFQAAWSTHTWGNAGAYLDMQADGNLVLYKQGGGPTTGGALWSTGTWGHAGALADFVTGELAVHMPAANPIWATGTGYLPAKDAAGNYIDSPSDTLYSNWSLIPGSWIESTNAWVLMQGDGNVVLYRKRDGKALWSSGTWNKSNVVAVMDPKGVLAVIDKNTGYPYWDTNTWNSPNAYAKIQSDLNFVVYTPGGSAVWNSQTWAQY